MTIDEATLRESLTTYANGVVMTSSDVDRMQRDLQTRLGARRGTSPRRPRLLVAAAVLVLVIAVAAGAVWLRRTADPPVPAAPPAPQGFGPVPAITFDEDATGSNLSAMHPDNTMSNLPAEQYIVHPVPPPPSLRWQVEGSTVVVDFVDAQGQTCRATKTWKAESDGVVSFDAPVMVGPACTTTGALASMSTRLSPVSEAGKAFAPRPSGPAQPVIDVVQLNGVWLRQGTGQLLAIDEVRGTAGSEYLLDDDGDIDVTPDASGSLTVGPDERIVLTSAGCAETVLGNAVATGTNTRNTLTVTVTSDPCQQFGGATVLTWIKVL